MKNQARQPGFLFHELGKSAQTGAAPPPPTLADITQQIIAMSNQGIPLGTLTMAQHVELAAALLAHLSKSVVATANKVLLKSLPGVYVESATATDVYLTDMTIERATVATPAGPQDAFKQEVIWQRWETES